MRSASLSSPTLRREVGVLLEMDRIQPFPRRSLIVWANLRETRRVKASRIVQTYKEQRNER